MTRGGLRLVIAAVLFSWLFSVPVFAVSEGQLDKQLEKNQLQELEKKKENCVGVTQDCGCRIVTQERNVAPYGRCVDEKQECKDGPIYWSCCLCEQTIGDKFGQQTVVVPLAESGHTNSSCEELCAKQKPPGRAYPQLGAGVLSPPKSASAPSAAQVQQALAMCFTPQECASAEYGGSADAFRPGHNCPSGQGRCIAPEPEIKLSYPLGGVTAVKGFRNLVALGFNYGVSIAAVVAAVMFVYGGFRYILGTAAENISRGKEIMIDASVGLLLTLGAMTILRTINPATLDMTRLDVFMVKKQDVLQSRYCADMKSDKPLKFAEAGTSPAFTPSNQITSYPVGQEETKCNYAYYAQGYSDGICRGRKCDQPGEACISCKTGNLEECKGNTKADVCVKAAFLGNIGGGKGIIPKKVMLVGVCNWVQPPKSLVQVGDNIPDYIEMKLVSSPGGGAYLLEPDMSKLDAIGKKCSSKGGLRGFVLGVLYHVNSSGAEEAVKAYVSLKEMGSGTITSLWGAVGVTIKEVAFGHADDALIVTRSHCSSGVSIYGGYADGGIHDFTDVKVAFYHGYTLNPNTSKPSISGHRFDDHMPVYWRYDELKKAVTEGQPITCSFDLTPQNAPLDPELYLWQKTLDPFTTP